MTRPTISPDALQAVSDWLIDAALAETTVEDVAAGLGERLVAAGFALKRLSVGSHLLHPNFEAQTVRWVRDVGVERELFPLGLSVDQSFVNSPLVRAIERPGKPVRRHLAGPDAVIDFPVLEGLAAQGMTDYVAIATMLASFSRPGLPTGMVATWASDRAGGFSDEEIEAIRRLQPRLAVAVKVAITHRIAEDIVAAYLGADAGRRVLAGEISRQQVETIRATLLFCDLTGFTALADRMDVAALTRLLDGYFDAIVAPITRRQGHVLKFMGDGLLAVFPIAEGEEGDAASRTVAAGLEALDAVAAVNDGLRRAGEEALDLEMALHLGDVAYGNVGAADRLDFTVIGPAVNEASRMEALCSTLGVRLLLSESLVAARPDFAGYDLVSLGEHALRGVTRPRPLFTLR